VWNGKALIYTQQRIIGADYFFDAVDAFDGMQNAPSFSTNSTGGASSYVYDENNLRSIELSAVADAGSYICERGTGADYCGNYNRATLVYRENSPGRFVKDVDIGQAYNLPVLVQ